jgi:hypothetical protein
VTLAEALFASFFTAMVLTSTLGIYVVGMMAWTRGEGKILSETGSHMGIRVIANELRQAMSVAVDANGLGLTYALPKQANGTDVIPIQSDGVARRIELDGTNLDILANGAVVRTICTGVILKDPLSPGGTQSYVIFTPNAGTTTRSVTVEVANQASSYEGTTQAARNRETIFLRNVPQLNL